MPSVADTPTDEISRICAEAIVYGDTDVFYRYVSPKLADYMPQTVYETVRADTLAPLGAFVAFERMERDVIFPRIVYCYVKYEKLGMKIKLVFHGGKIDGLWLSYYETKKGNGI